ncbi:hypothetical protein QYM36_016038 [Artemia franciscana]|uniref:Zinc finger C2H2 LYAR-type domain-containing protein n=1 Tax=Artemia franciscana TaxID=6661 RepID=A0AA88HBD6_ARTSF|nr:hypothetical protein QYM36_016038 [Artemia franciscana]KAK2705890.1 hypothetical protein QYM36_016038 [Artemia franciscana]
MVFFTCDGCGESIKKPSVPKHRSQCRRSFKLSCMDCSKEFHGEDYNSHIKCITENQKYAGAGPGLNKNEKKQEEWVGLVQNAIRNASGINPEVKQLLEYVSQFDNIPRKQTKFLNFLKNSQRRSYNERIAQMAWNLISKELEKLRTPQQEPEKEKFEGNGEGVRIEETSETIELNKKKSKKEKKKDKKYHNHEEVLDATLEPEGTLKQKGHKRKQAEDEETVDIGLYDGAAKKKKKKKEKENVPNMDGHGWTCDHQHRKASI